MGKRISAKARRAAEAGDFAALEKEIESGKSAPGALLLQLATSDEQIAYLLEKGADPDEAVFDESVNFKTFRQLAEMCAGDGDDSLMALLTAAGATAEEPTGEGPFIGRWTCQFTEPDEGVDPDEELEDVMDRLDGSTLVIHADRYEDTLFGHTGDGEWTAEGNRLQLADGSVLELGERRGQPLLQRRYDDEEHGWIVVMGYRKS